MLGFSKDRRRARLPEEPFPEEWLRILESSVPLYGELSPDDQRELRGHIQVFLAEKEFEGCGGLEITDEIRVTIAAQACFLLLHRKTDYYPGLYTVLVYPSSYVAHTRRWSAGGIVTEGPQVRLGEAWRHGPVVPARDRVRACQRCITAATPTAAAIHAHRSAPGRSASSMSSGSANTPAATTTSAMRHAAPRAVRR
ncbi:MAG: zinc-dependent peptidase [Candidatus Brocadiaceae bacterium]|nr:zinc-dependent peptidase [Candidatus Brocadiaceae bacterium]